jgi:hypothetical protein
MISQIRKRFDYNIQRGIIKDEPRPGAYDSIASAVWVLITFWVPQRLVSGSSHSIQERQFKEMIWNQFYPHFTERGLVEFKQLIAPMLEQYSADN